MVDISAKEAVERISVATGRIKLRKMSIEAIEKGEVKKGDVLGCAQTAAILAVKKTPDMIPLCHPISIEDVNVEFSIDEKERGSCIEAKVEVKSVGKTGVEMDALHGVSVALLTIWDMVKSLEKDERGNYPDTMIEEIKVEKKEKRAAQ
jgi:cyclic pyranopterin phosphate synthase